MSGDHRGDGHWKVACWGAVVRALYEIVDEIFVYGGCLYLMEHPGAPAHDETLRDEHRV